MTTSRLSLSSTRSDALVRLTQAVETATTFDELLMLAQRAVTQVLDVDLSSVLLFGDNATCSVASAFPPSAHLPDPLELPADSVVYHVAHERQPRQIDLTDEQPFEAFVRASGAHAALLVPLIAQDKAIGVLLLGAHDEAHQFSEDDVALARVLAGQLSAAIVAFRLSEAAQLRNEELATLNEIAAAVTSTLDTRELYREIVHRLNAYFKVDAGSLLLLDEATGELEFTVTMEGEREVLVGKRVPQGQGVVGYVAATGDWVVVHDAPNDPRFYRKISEDIGYETRSILCVPIIAKGNVIGVIELLNKINGPFTEEDAVRLNRMAAFIGVALDNARLFKQVADGRDQLEAILNSTADGMIMTDLVGTVVNTNDMANELFGATEAEIIGQPLGRLLQQLRSRAHAVITRPWGGQTSADSELSSVTEYELGGQRRRFIRHLMLPVRDAAGKVYGRLAVFRDITHEKELEQLRDDYTSMLVHDLRAPLTSVMNGITMTQRGLGGPVTPQQQTMLSIAQAGSQTMLELVNNLLDISRMEQGQLHLDLEPLPVYAILDAAIERIEASARSRHIQIEQRLSLDLPPIEADRDIIVRVLQNLLDNALKFSPQRTTVIVGAMRFNAESTPPPSDMPVHPPLTSGTWIVVWVQDQGPGVPAAYHERIFEKFGQVRGRKGRGTGLGLTFCKLAVEAHHGHIWLESTQHVGSTFAFALPLENQA
jgi:NtrC-family two-component system sensor histidine kinase KinB